MTEPSSSTKETLRLVLPSSGVLEEILSVEDNGVAGVNQPDEIAAAQALLEKLTDEEIGSLARVSYAYWAWEKLHPEREQSMEFRSKSARFEVHRYRVAENYNDDKALARIKASIAWRTEEHVELLRLCFAPTVAETSALDTSFNVLEVSVSMEEIQQIHRFETLILKELQIQKMVVRGHDRRNRAILIKLSRQGPWPSDTGEAAYGYKVAHGYFAERGLATSEYLTRGTLPELVVIADFADYDSSNSPPMGVMVEGLLGLQPNYPERLGKAVLKNSPMWLQATANLLKPFLTESSRSRLVVSGSTLDKWASYIYNSPKSITDIMRELVDESQAMPFMLPDGSLSSDITPERQVKELPFFTLYDQNTS